MKVMDTETMARDIVSGGRMINEMVYRSQSECLANAVHTRRCSDLSVPQFNAVLMVQRRGRISIGELAKLLFVSAPSASAMVDRLVEKGCLQRTPDPDDRRKVVVSVDAEALKDIERVEAAITRTFVALLEEIGPETARQWYEVVMRIKTVLESREDRFI